MDTPTMFAPRWVATDAVMDASIRNAPPTGRELAERTKPDVLRLGKQV